MKEVKREEAKLSVGKGRGLAQKRKSHSELDILRVLSVANLVDNNLSVGDYFKIAESNIRRWRMKYTSSELPTPDLDVIAKINNERKVTRKAQFERLEKKLYDWIRAEREKFLPLSQERIRSKALNFIERCRNTENQYLKLQLGHTNF